MQKAVMGAILALCLWTGAVAQNMYDIEQELTEENFEASRQKRDELYNRALQQSFLIDYNVGFSKFPKSYTVANSSYRINTEISSRLDIQYYITKHFGVVLDY